MVKWLMGAIISFYCLLVLGSNILEYFVVYGRIVKQVVPILCLLAAFVVGRSNTKFVALMGILVLIGFGANYKQLFQVTFSSEAKVAHNNFMMNDEREGNQYNKIIACYPYHTQCENDGSYQHCDIKEQFMSLYSVDYFQFDGMTPENRQLFNQHKMYYQIISCPL